MQDISGTLSALIIGVTLGLCLPLIGELVGRRFGKIGGWRALFVFIALTVSVTLSSPYWLAAMIACVLGLWEYWVHFKGKLRFQ